tara:strand:- start:706 stop:2262 length:1557 start_codon:yes stop_codon:yes gene_type:complete
MLTFAFKSSGNFWSTKYDFSPTNYSYLGRDFFTCINSKSTNDGKTLDATNRLWKHTPAASKSWYEESPFKPSISFSFNDNVSVEKIMKSMSIEGEISPTAQVSGTIRVNSDTENNHGKKFNINSQLVERNRLGSNYYFDLKPATESKISTSNFRNVGQIVAMRQLYNEDFSDQFLSWNVVNGLRGGIWGWNKIETDAGVVFLNDGVTLKDVLTDTSEGGKYETLVNNGQEWMGRLFGFGAKQSLEGTANSTPYDPFESDSRLVFIELSKDSPRPDFSSRSAKFFVDAGDGPIGQINPLSTAYTDLTPLFRSGKDETQFINGGQSAKYTYGSFDARPRYWDDDDGFVPVPGFPEDIRHGVVVAFQDQFEGSICEEKYTTENGVEISACDFNLNGNISTDDLISVLSVLGTQETGHLNSETEIGPNFWANVLSEVIINFGEEVNQPAPVVQGTISRFNENSYPNGSLFLGLVMATPTVQDGDSAKGLFCDVSLTFGVGSGKFEIDAINLNYEPTTLDHSR